MFFFDKYKIIDIDYSMSEQEYNNNYLWDINSAICPKYKFFFIKAFKFEEKNKIYTKTIEYISVHPSDIFTLYDFYQSNYHKSNDISYILSYQEIEKFILLKSSKSILKLNNNFLPIYKHKNFLLFVNEETNEKIFQIIYSNNINDLNNYINKMKISSFYLKLIEKVSEMNDIVKLYKKYISGKIALEERNNIKNFINNLKEQFKYMGEPLVKLISSKSYEISINNENKTLIETKKELLIQYINYFKKYEEDREDQYELDEDGIYFENVLNDITLFRHSEGYVKKILDESYNIYKKDQKEVNEEFVKVQEEINGY